MMTTAEDQVNPLVVTPIDEGEGVYEMHKILGLSQERWDELTKKVKHLMVDNSHLQVIANLISKECVHANELFLVAFMLGRNTRDDRNKLEEILKGNKSHE